MFSVSAGEPGTVAVCSHPSLLVTTLRRENGKVALVLHPPTIVLNCTNTPLDVELIGGGTGVTRLPPDGALGAPAGCVSARIRPCLLDCAELYGLTGTVPLARGSSGTAVARVNWVRGIAHQFPN